jgi:O-antigen/teichoic acid export membrane protein
VLAISVSSHSIVRRSLLVTGLVVAGHSFYYLLVVAGNGMLDPAAFGRFYTGWAILNVLVTPGAIVALMLSGHLAEYQRAGGDTAVLAAFSGAARGVLPWIVAATLAIEVVLFVAGGLLGIDSIALVMLLPVLAASIAIVEIMRAALQGMFRFAAFGVSWLLWCLAQFLLGALGLWLIGAPWAGFVGMLGATILAGVTLAFILSGSGRASEPPPGMRTPSLRQALPFFTAQVGFVLLNNADIFIAFLIMQATGLGTYSAAAVLPKAIVTATQPIANVVLPVVIGIRDERRLRRHAVAKGLCVTAALAGFGAVVLFMLGTIACGGRFGIRSCEPSLMVPLLFASVPLAVTRVAITADLGLGGRLAPHLPALAMALFLGFGFLERPPATALAKGYAVCALLTLCAVGTAALLRRPLPVPEG